MRVGVVLLLMVAAAFGQSLSSARADLVEDLEALAKWCTRKSIIGARNRVYEIILRYAPDHEKARMWLRYEKRDDKWVRTRKYREPRDRNTAALPEFERRLRALGAGFKVRMFAYAQDKAVAVATRRAILTDILALAPDDEEVRTANGEVRVDGRWLLQESLTARKRRRRMVQFATKALESVPAPRRDQLDPYERGLGIRWTGALRGRWWRFAGTAGLREMTDALEFAEASAAFVAAAIPDETPERSLTLAWLKRIGAGVYYFGDPEDGRQFVMRHRAFSNRDRKFALQLGGTWVPKTWTAAIWSSTRELRLDATTRDAIQVLMRARYGRTKAWVQEGFGFYLSWYLVGTRLTYYVQQTRYAQQDEWDEATAPHADWLRIARALRAKGRPTDFRFLIGKNLNQLTLEDVIHAHSIAAYMIEGHPRRVSAFLAEYGADGDIDKALEHVYGLTLATMEERLARWLVETK
jgi:hypothetical protein